MRNLVDNIQCIYLLVNKKAYFDASIQTLAYTVYGLYPTMNVFTGALQQLLCKYTASTSAVLVLY